MSRELACGVSRLAGYGEVAVVGSRCLVVEELQLRKMSTMFNVTQLQN